VFYALLALFPAIAALVSIYGIFADPQTITHHLDTASGVIPGGAIDVIRDQLSRLAAEPRAILGMSFVIGLGVSIWSANGGIKALFDALNVVYEEKEKRSFVRLNGLSLAFTIGMLVFLLIAIASIIAVPISLNYFPSFIASMLNIARWPVLLVFVVLALSMLYIYGPSRRKPRWSWINWGSAFAALVWLGASGLFSWYAANFGNFNKTYGSLGAVIGFMMWIWLSIIVILIGAKLNAETERQTVRDSTEGAAEATRSA